MEEVRGWRESGQLNMLRSFDNGFWLRFVFDRFVVLSLDNASPQARQLSTANRFVEGEAARREGRRGDVKNQLLNQ